MRTSASLLLCALLARPASAGSAGAEAFDFLLMDAGARAAALGGAFTALASGPEALFYNPAGLARTKSNEISCTHDQRSQGVTRQAAGAAFKSGFGAALHTLDFGGIPRTTLSSPDGALGSFGLRDISLGVGLGRSFLDETLSLGLGAKALRESVDGVRADGYAFDAGALASPLPGLSLGASLLNAGPEVRFLTQKERLPLCVRAGAAFEFSLAGTRETLAFDVSKVRTDKLRLGAGVEAALGEAFAVRAGFTTRSDAGVGVTGGVMAGWNGLEMDYAFVPFGDLGLSHLVSLSFRWGAGPEPPEREKPPPRKAAAEELFRRAREAVAAGSYDAAKRDLAAAAGLLGPADKRNFAYYERMGFIALRQNDPRRAKSLYMEAIKTGASLDLGESAQADAYAGLGECLMRQEDYENARWYLLKALSAGPSEEMRAGVEARLQELQGARP
jgi:tetratricopeptide (TPR) repeat protein